MSSFVMKNATLLIGGGINMSAYCRSVKINHNTDTPDNTTFGTNWTSAVAGLHDFSIDFEFNTDFASSIDGFFFNKIGQSIAVDIRADSAATGGTNPAWKGNVVVSAFAPIGQSIGNLATQTVTCPGNGALIPWYS